MSTANALIYVENIRKALAKADPANAAVYAKNAADYFAELNAMDAPLRARLAKLPESRRWLVSSEGASATWPVTSVGGRPISGRSTQRSRARRSKFGV
jgi:ABC-type Zn uptake system ZnuABC Zn-binding protein ZnuA